MTEPVIGPDPVCSGTKTYTWTYTDCTGSSGDWVYTYTISPPTFILPANGVCIVPCLSDAQVIPAPPVVNNFAEFHLFLQQLLLVLIRFVVEQDIHLGLYGLYRKFRKLGLHLYS